MARKKKGKGGKRGGNAELLEASAAEAAAEAELAAEEERCLTAILDSEGLWRKNIPKDGSCLFRAVADAAYGLQQAHIQLRADCMEFLADHREDFEPFVMAEGMPFDHYVFEMSKPKAWGSQVELQCLSLMLNINFLIYQPPPGPQIPLDNGFSTTVRLSFLGGNHYDVVYPIAHREALTFCQSLVYSMIDTATGAKPTPYHSYNNIVYNSWLRSRQGEIEGDSSYAAAVAFDEDGRKLSGYYKKGENDEDEGPWKSGGGGRRRGNRGRRNRYMRLDQVGLELVMPSVELDSEGREVIRDPTPKAKPNSSQNAWNPNDGDFPGLQSEQLFPSLGGGSGPSTGSAAPTASTAGPSPAVADAGDGGGEAAAADAQPAAPVWGATKDWTTVAAVPPQEPTATATSSSDGPAGDDETTSSQHTQPSQQTTSTAKTGPAPLSAAAFAGLSASPSSQPHQQQQQPSHQQQQGQQQQRNFPTPAQLQVEYMRYIQTTHNSKRAESGLPPERLDLTPATVGVTPQWFIEHFARIHGLTPPGGPPGAPPTGPPVATPVQPPQGGSANPAPVGERPAHQSTPSTATAESAEETAAAAAVPEPGAPFVRSEAKQAPPPGVPFGRSSASSSQPQQPQQPQKQQQPKAPAAALPDDAFPELGAAPAGGKKRVSSTPTWQPAGGSATTTNTAADNNTFSGANTSNDGWQVSSAAAAAGTNPVDEWQTIAKPKPKQSNKRRNNGGGGGGSGGRRDGGGGGGRRDGGGGGGGGGRRDGGGGRGRGRGRGRGGGGGGGPRVCYRCNKPGHISRDCPN